MSCACSALSTVLRLPRRSKAGQSLASQSFQCSPLRCRPAPFPRPVSNANHPDTPFDCPTDSPAAGLHAPPHRRSTACMAGTLLLAHRRGSPASSAVRDQAMSAYQIRLGGRPSSEPKRLGIPGLRMRRGESVGQQPHPRPRSCRPTPAESGGTAWRSSSLAVPRLPYLPGDRWQADIRERFTFRRRYPLRAVVTLLGTPERSWPPCRPRPARPCRPPPRSAGNAGHPW